MASYVHRLIARDARRRLAKMRGEPVPREPPPMTIDVEKLMNPKFTAMEQVEAAGAVLNRIENDRWTEASFALELLRDGSDLLDQKRPGAREASEIIETILRWMTRIKPTRHAVARLRAMAKLLNTDTPRIRREWCVEGIKTFSPLVVDDPFAAEALAKWLGEQAPELAGLTEDLESVREKMLAYDPKPRGKRGKKSAEKILAEFVMDEKDALGLRVRDDGGEDAEKARLRKAIARRR